MDDRGGRARGDRNSEDDGSPSGGARALLIEALHTLTGEWRAIIIAIIGALIGLLLADLLGDSDNATTLAAVLGAAAGTWLKGLADRLRWRERTLTGIGGVLGLLALPRPRTWILEQARSAAVNTASPTSTIAALMSGTLVTAIGAATVLVVEPIVDGRAGGARAGLELDADSSVSRDAVSATAQARTTVARCAGMHRSSTAAGRAEPLPSADPKIKPWTSATSWT